MNVYFSECVYFQILDKLNIGICITEAELENPGPRILYVNDEFSRLCGYSKEELIGETPRILQGLRTDRKELDRLKKDLKEKGHFVGAAINYRKNGEEYFVFWEIMTIYDENNKPLYYLGIHKDSTKTKQALDTIDLLLGRIKEYNQINK